MMGDIKFLDTLRAYDKDNIPQVTWTTVVTLFCKQKYTSLKQGISFIKRSSYFNVFNVFKKIKNY